MLLSAHFKNTKWQGQRRPGQRTSGQRQPGQRKLGKRKLGKRKPGQKWLVQSQPGQNNEKNMGGGSIFVVVPIISTFERMSVLPLARV